MKNLIVANWKMTPNTAKEAANLFNFIANYSKKINNAKIIVCPPSIWLGLLNNFKKGKVFFGAQDVFWENPLKGKETFTGEISVKMLKNLGVEYVIIGHSERRNLPFGRGETDEIINKKMRQALENGLSVIFCVGEIERDKEGNYLKFIKEELINGLNKIPTKFFKKIIIAYEPIWAISSKKKTKTHYNSDNPEDTFQMATYIKRVIFSLFGKPADNLPIIYGGSVDPKNAADFLKKGNVKGLLVGRTSWSIRTFRELLENISEK